METSLEQATDMDQESLSLHSPPDSGKGMDLRVLRANQSEALCLPAENEATNEENDFEADIIILPPPPTKQKSAEQSEIIQTDSNQSEAVCLPAHNKATNEEYDFEADIIILPPPSTKQKSAEQSEIIQTDSNQSEAVCLPAQNEATNEENDFEADIIILPPPSTKQKSAELSEIIQTDSNQSEAVYLPAQNEVTNEENDFEADIIVLPPPSTKQKSAEQSEIIQTDFITIPFPEVDTAQVKIISSEVIVPSSDQNEVEMEQIEPNAEDCLITVLSSSQIESDIMKKDQQYSLSTRIATRSSSRKTKIEQNCSGIESHTFKAPYPVQTTVVIEKMETEENESTLSADSSLLDNQHSSSEELLCNNSQPSSTASSDNIEQSNETASENAEDTEDLLVEQYSEAENIEIPEGSLYAEDKGPRIYEVPQSFTSKPLNPTYLTYAFKDLPIFGRPKNKAQLPEFQRHRIKQFVGSGLDDEEFDNLAAYCCPDNLRTGNELIMQSNPGQGFFPSEVDSLSLKNKEMTSSHNLNTVRNLKLRLERDTKNLYSKRYKYRGVRMIPLNNDDEDNTPVVTIGKPIVPGKELLFVIRWYRPFPYNPKDRFGYRSRHSVFSNNIVMLGRHKLSLLRDHVVCPNDVDMRVDVSDRPDELPRSSAKDLFPSGFLFINNVFYVDKRQGCIDYTAYLRRWAKIRGIGDFPCKDMSEVRLDELVVKLGHPEVYVHQGNCEHLFTISEVRLLAAADPLRPGAFPAHTMLSQHQTIYCTTCAEFGAKWIVVGCPRVPFDPAFFCEKCFKLYLYKDGKKIGNFKAYLYRGNEINALKPQG